MLPDEPFRALHAKLLIQKIALAQTNLRFIKHAIDELTKAGFTATDARQCLRFGIVEEPEFENGAWRYRVRDAQMMVVVEFDEPEHITVVTGWNINKGRR
jgi:hypothetical protein